MEDNSITNTEVLKKKRGRKKKSELVDDALVSDIQAEPHVPKKRGRKPKGGKLITKPIETNEDNVHLSNIILHLKCSMKDIDMQHTLESTMIGNPMSYKPVAPPDIMTYTDNNQLFSTYNDEMKNKTDNYAYTKPTDINIITSTLCSKCNDVLSKSDEQSEDLHLNLKDINYKLKEIKLQLYKDSNPDKKSACFWCTYEYDNPACYIPKYELDGNTCGYGSFCRPECAVAYLMKENIDDSA